VVVRNINNAGNWIRSSRCGDWNADCVELNRRDTWVIIRDSKGEAGAHLEFGDDSWSTFMTHCRSTI
jgi:hypothetical protein